MLKHSLRLSTAKRTSHLSTPVVTVIRHRRALSTASPKQPSKEEINAAAIQASISGPAGSAIKATGRFLKYSLIGAFTLAITAYAGFEATHLYVEHLAMQPETNEEVKKYQWDISGENWHSNPESHGTDPGLGFFGRHAARAAWMVHNWGVGPAMFVSPRTSVTHGTGLPRPAVNGADMQILQELDYLKIALVIAESKINSSTLHPLTIPAFFNGYASLLEKLGNNYLSLSKQHFERAWEGYSGNGLHAARIALKLGDITSRLHQNDEAQKWWKTAIQLSQGESRPDVGPLLQPTYAPTSPWAQRIIASALVSLSAYYAQTGNLRDAETFEESALALLRSIPTPESIATASHPQALHALYILQRSSLLSIHLAEVLHAQKKPLASSIQGLMAAAESSERVARALSGLPLRSPSGTSNEGLIPQDDTQILPAYSSSRCMADVASRLFRDAKRTAAESWNLLGVLYEQKEGRSSKTALECYDRAIQWAGKAGENDVMEANEATTDSDWNVFWSNFQRAKKASEEESRL